MIYNLKLQNFRNYNNYELSFKNNINIIVGRNGIGKTNILESIYLLLLTKSFKKIKDIELINENKPYYRIEGTILDKKRVVYFDQNGKKVLLGGKSIKKLSEYIGDNQIIFNGPDEEFLIKGSPRDRRKYFNIEISQIDLEYLKHLSNYQKTLKNKNILLKTKTPDLILIDIYNDQLLESYIYLVKSRKKYLDNINKLINKYWNQYYKTNISVHYLFKNDLGDNEDKKTLLEAFKKIKNKEIIYKNSLIGPHLDDIQILVENKVAEKVLSAGQMKIAILALKLSEIEIISSIKNKHPIILLDDLFSELDQENSNKLISQLSEKMQVIITTTDLIKIDKNIIQQANIIELSEGK